MLCAVQGTADRSMTTAGKSSMACIDNQARIVDHDINRILVGPLKKGVRLHALIDSCHSGTCMDLRHIASVDRATQRIEWKDEGECPCASCSL